MIAELFHNGKKDEEEGRQFACFLENELSESGEMQRMKYHSWKWKSGIME